MTVVALQFRLILWLWQ